MTRQRAQVSAEPEAWPSLQLPGEDLTLIAYTAAAGSPAKEKLDFLTRRAGHTPSAEPAEASTQHATES